MILRASVIVTMDGPPIRNGAVEIYGARISDVGTFEQIKAHDSGEIVDLGDLTWNKELEFRRPLYRQLCLQLPAS